MSLLPKDSPGSSGTQLAAGGGCSLSLEGQALDVLTYLARDDKWFVAGGMSSVYAPPNPVWAEWPAFWDEVHLGRQPLPRLFTVLLLDEHGRHLPLRFRERHWQPDRLRQTYTAPGLEVVEEKTNLPRDGFAARFTLRLTSGATRQVHLVLWSWQPRLEEGPCVESVDVQEGYLRYRLRLPEETRYNLHPQLDLHVALGADRAPESWTVNPSEPHGPGPEYRFSPLREKFRDGRLPGDLQLDVGVRETRDGPRFAGGHLHLAVHYPLKVEPGEETRIAVGAGLGFTPAWAAGGLASVKLDAPERSATAWREYFAGVPDFRCSDPYLQKYYWYRWYQLRAHQVNMDFGGFQHPCILEGIGPFRRHISYSAHCHMRECQWMHDTAFAWGSLENMLANQLPDGSLPGHVNERGVAGAAGSITGTVSFYHSNWANAWRVHQHHPDREFLARVYPPLVRYAEYFRRERDADGTHLYDVVNQGETGQEYMPRYQVVHPHADDWGPIRLKGVDSTFYLYELCRALAWIAAALERPAEESAAWAQHAEAVRRAVCRLMWDPGLQLFCDVDPDGMRRTSVKSAVCFYPFMSDLAGHEHLESLRRHLLNPDEFWTTWPFPATSAEDPLFSPEAEWKGKRTNCPWNGRVWPMTNSHLCEALAEAAQRHDPSLATFAVQAIRRFVELMFFDHDPDRPNTWEHYNPFTGAPCDYRGVDDYQHSWVVDLLLRYVAGIQPGDGSQVVVHPLPMGVSFDVSRVRVKGHWLSVSFTPERGFRISVDGAARHESETIERVVLDLEH